MSILHRSPAFNFLDAPAAHRRPEHMRVLQRIRDTPDDVLGLHLNHALRHDDTLNELHRATIMIDTEYAALCVLLHRPRFGPVIAQRAHLRAALRTPPIALGPAADTLALIADNRIRIRIVTEQSRRELVAVRDIHGTLELIRIGLL